MTAHQKPAEPSLWPLRAQLAAYLGLLGQPVGLLYGIDQVAYGEAYDAVARELADKFIESFKKFEVFDAIRNAGPKL